MNKNENILDEFQEQKMLSIERNAAWLAFWGLLLVIIVQVIAGFGEEWMLRSIAGEWIVLICLAFYLVVGCIKNGLWSRHLQPNPKTNVRASLIAAAICGPAISLAVYFGFGKLAAALISGAISFALTFIITLVLLTILVNAYKKKLAELESRGEGDADA